MNAVCSIIHNTYVLLRKTYKIESSAFRTKHDFADTAVDGGKYKNKP